MKNYQLPVIIEKDEEGFFVADCPSLQGCHTQGVTLEESLKNIRDAISLHIQDRLENNEPIPQSKAVSLTSLEITV